MTFWLHSCPKCEGDLTLKHDLDGPYVQCMQCGGELTAAEQRSLQKLGYVNQDDRSVEAASA